MRKVNRFRCLLISTESVLHNSNGNFTVTQMCAQFCPHASNPHNLPNMYFQWNLFNHLNHYSLSKCVFKISSSNEMSSRLLLTYTSCKDNFNSIMQLPDKPPKWLSVHSVPILPMFADSMDNHLPNFNNTDSSEAFCLVLFIKTCIQISKSNEMSK